MGSSTAAHSIIMEKNRLQLFEAVQAFLDEAQVSIPFGLD